MNVQLMEEVWQGARSIGSDALVVMLALARLADAEGECEATVDTIAQESRVTDESVRKIIKRLKKQRFLLTMKQGVGRGNPSRYQIFPRGDAPESDALESDAPENPLLEENPLSKTPFQIGVLENANIETGARARLEGVDVFHTSTSNAVDVSCADAQPAPTATTATAATSPPNIEPDLLALYDITALLPGVCGPKKTSELKAVIGALRSKRTTPNSPEATPQNIRLFAEKWRALARGRPYPGQIFTHWDEVLCPISTPETEGNHGKNQHGRLEKRPQSASAQRGQERIDQLNGLGARREELEARKREMAERSGARTLGREAPTGA